MSVDEQGLSAPGESCFTDGRDGGGDGDFIKIGTPCKGGSTDAGDRARDDQGRERRDILKGLIADFGQAAWKIECSIR